MKKILFIAAFAVFTVITSQAQDTLSRKPLARKGHIADKIEKLNLTEAQKAKLKAINEEAMAEAKLIHEKYTAKRAQILTAEQVAELEKMKADGKKKLGKAKGELVKGAKDAREAKGKHGDSQGKFDQLNLSQDQQEKMKMMREKYKTQTKEVMSNDQFDQAQKKQMMQDIQKKQKEELKTVLTDAQIQKLGEMKQRGTP